MIKLSPTDPRYPRRLRALQKKAPDPLWVRGTLPPPDLPVVGIVGTRRLTPLGQRIARVLSSALARAGAVIISGLAQGIDSTAHGAALDVGGHTVAVLGEGLAYFDDHGPSRRRQLARKVLVHGALVSEFPLEMRGSGWTFPKRNATLAAMSDVLVVVEAPHDSGALITAREMNDLHRPVFVVPGPIDGPTWAGSNDFIARGTGRFLGNLQQVAERLGLELPELASASHVSRIDLMKVLTEGPADTDSIAAALGMPTTEAALLLAEQLIAGRIVATGDGRFALP